MSIFAPDIRTVTEAGVPEFSAGETLTPAILEDPAQFAALCEGARARLLSALGIIGQPINVWRLGTAEFRVRVAHEAHCATCKRPEPARR